MTCWSIPNLVVECVLVSVTKQLEADGCVLKFTEASCKVTTPDHLVPGDFVKVRLWLEGEGPCIDIRLAEVIRIHQHWITLEVIQISHHDRMRLQQFVDARAVTQKEQPGLIDRLLIRA
ncbi:MAG TPA: hypothetical protein VKP13_06710 [Nitrospira sp.]|nr:hypothetical protein [Nitrospira sp.]